MWEQGADRLVIKISATKSNKEIAELFAPNNQRNSGYLNGCIYGPNRPLNIVRNSIKK